MAAISATISMKTKTAIYADVHQQRQPRVFHGRSNQLSEHGDDDFRVRCHLAKKIVEYLNWTFNQRLAKAMTQLADIDNNNVR